MDEPRQIRFLVPPFFMFGSLALGACLAGKLDLKCYPIDKLIPLAAGLAALSIPLGFLITSASIFSLRIIWFFIWLSVRGSYEAWLSDETWMVLWPKLRNGLHADKKWVLYAAATFDHQLLAPGINGWIQRRWTTFYLSVHCIAAVLLAHLVAHFIPISETRRWKIYTAAVVILFLTNAVIAWLQTMRMFKFQAFRTRSPDSTSGLPSNC